jgi:uncharacterized protein DUF6064
LLPFTRDEFIAVFAAYNSAIWPAQIVAYILGFVAVMLLARHGRDSGRLIACMLALSWFWTGIVYQWVFFARINRAAYLFGGGFVLEAALLVGYGLSSQRLAFRYRDGLPAYVGLLLLGYAAAIYPLLGLVMGDTYPSVPTFGLTPCPVTLFTLGFLLMAETVSMALLVVPLAWSFIGGTAAILLNVPQDWGLLIGGPVAIVAIWIKRRTARYIQ